MKHLLCKRLAIVASIWKHEISKGHELDDITSGFSTTRVLEDEIIGVQVHDLSEISFSNADDDD